MQGDNVMAHFRGTNNELGKSFNADLRDGQRPSFSLRALGSLVNENGRATVKNMQVITYDRVYFPSHKKAYTTKIITTESANGTISSKFYDIDGRNYFKAKQDEINLIAESGNLVDMEQPIVTPMTQGEINNFILTESTNLRNIVNTFDVLYESIELDPGMHQVYMKTKLGDTIVLSLENAVAREIIEGVNDYF